MYFFYECLGVAGTLYHDHPIYLASQNLSGELGGEVD